MSFRPAIPTAIAIALAATPALAQQRVATAKAETLVKATESWNGKPYTHYARGQPQLTMLRVTIDANTALPWHYHPMPNAGYVLSGELTIVDKASGKKQTFKQGQAFAESVDDVHHGIAGPEPTTLLIVYAGTPGVPTSVPVNKNQKEY
jgi:quercetin dioxygenase-like cupin family protein